MDGFSASEGALELQCTCPDSAFVKAKIISFSQRELSSFLRQWISEGIPAAFNAAPIYYESVREWLGNRLGVNPKAITLIGSARTGYSFGPNTFGKPFTPGVSDLDLAVISRDAFKRFTDCFTQWANEYHNGTVTPPNLVAESYWKNNFREGPQNIKYGFIDNNRVPNFKQYAFAQSTAQSLWLLREKLGATENAPKVKKASIRFFENWDAFLRRQQFSFGILRKRLAS